MTRIGIVKWGDPTGEDPEVYYGLRVNGAYVRSGGQPVGYRSMAEARRAKAALKAQHPEAPASAERPLHARPQPSLARPRDEQRNL